MVQIEKNNKGAIMKKRILKSDRIRHPDGVFSQVPRLPQKPIKLHHVNQGVLNDLCRNIGNGGAS